MGHSLAFGQGFQCCRSFDSIILDDARDLEKDFTEDKVRNAVNDIRQRESFGVWTDGTFANFHNKGVAKKSLNPNFISLIPKVAGADDSKNFKRISLVWSVCKILDKDIASRLRKVVGPNQHAFITGR